MKTREEIRIQISEALEGDPRDERETWVDYWTKHMERERSEARAEALREAAVYRDFYRSVLGFLNDCDGYDTFTDAVEGAVLDVKRMLGAIEAAGRTP